VRITFDHLTGRLFQETKTHLVVLMPWPAMRAFCTPVRRADWKVLTPRFAIPPEVDRGVAGRARRAGPQLDLDYQGIEEIRRFCAFIPGAIRNAVAPFPERHWQLLTWIARTGLAAEHLLTSNPALAFAVACGSDLAERETHVRYAQKYCLLPYHPQRAILAAFGFPATELARRVLRKLSPRATTLDRLVLLRRTLSDQDVAERLAHLPAINEGVLALLEDGTVAQLTPAALRELAVRPDGAADAARKLAETIRLWGLVRPTEVLPRIGRVERIEVAHREVTADAVKLRAPFQLGFPPPPIPGTTTIVPIRTRAMLVEEGRLQHNCAADYEEKIVTGLLALYRVLAPERCTLSLKQERCGRRVISELKTKCNGQPSARTVETVKAWIAGAQG